MKLGEFIEKFVERNSLIRLLYKEKGGHKIVNESWNDVSMEHDVLNGKGINRHYINNEVIEICSILVGSPYSEAINICIEGLDNQPYIQEVIEDRQYYHEESE